MIRGHRTGSIIQNGLLPEEKEVVSTSPGQCDHIVIITIIEMVIKIIANAAAVTRSFGLISLCCFIFFLEKSLIQAEV